MSAEPDLGVGGRGLWDAFPVEQMTPIHRVMLLEACRAKDRLDKLDLILSGDVETWARLTHRTRTEDYELLIDDALAKANQTASSMRQLLAAIPSNLVKKPKVTNALDELKNRRAARGADAPSQAAATRGRK